MTEKEKYIERVGLFYEKYGLPKMAGRILGYLISSETDYNSFSDLIDALKASKGSISGNINLLLNQNMITKHMKSGDRKSYYEISIKNLENILDSKIKSISEFKSIFECGNELKEKKKTNTYVSISEIIRYYEFLEKEIPLLKEKWGKIKKG